MTGSTRNRRRGRPPAVLPQSPRFDAIWAAVAAIPAGQWASYGEVARRAGMPRAARQVGVALKMVPPALDLPWHRVVGAGGRIALPERSRSRAEQIRRLLGEGVQVAGGRIRTGPRRHSLDAMLWKPLPRR